MRTKLVDASGNPKYTNRLIAESSPYLKQHAHNPVDWYPWSDEAFQLARQENKPVFLSIGYSTCHWCHVMEHESFDNESIAAFLNEHFVSIKLDREQRPDLDEIYMTGVQLTTGQGGWPMSNFTTADGKPFFAGTYYPPADFLQLLQQINTVWRERHGEVMAQAEQNSENIALYTAAQAEVKAIEEDLLPAATEELLSRLDETHGGFGSAPKFPNESQLLVLLEDLDRHQGADSKAALMLTLDKMSQGGIFDQIGGGFHRYSVDARWLVPHFEKMLYNQAQMIRVYARGHHLCNDPAYRRIVDRTIHYVLRDMTSDDGRFYSATDADSEGEEGKFFVWQRAQLESCLSPEDVELVQSLYGFTAEGNFEGANIPNLAASLETYSVAHNLSIDELLPRLDKIHQTLYHKREEREHPLRDEKFITAWNGMMISALVQADISLGTSLGTSEYQAVAVKAAEALWQHQFDQTDESLWRVGLGRDVSIQGNLEDYAYFAEACLQLYLVTADKKWQIRGETLIKLMLARFWDTEQGGFFLSRDVNEGPLITRPKSPMDGAMPSGNSAALMAMVLAHEASGDAELAGRINKMISSFSGLLLASPSAFSYMLTGITRFLQGSREPIQWAAEGNLRLEASKQDSIVRLKFRFEDGWHMNSNIASEDMIATRIEGGGQVSYPEAESIQVAFSESALQVYAGEFEVLVADVAGPLQVHFQSCNDSICLKPEILTVRVAR